MTWLAPLVLGLIPGLVAAQAAPSSAPAATLAGCAAEPDAQRRLACYDGLAGRQAPAATGSPALAPPATAGNTVPGQPGGLAPEVPLVKELDAQVAGTGLGKTPGGTGSVLSAYWELDEEDKRGTFRFMSYRPNYFLPVHYTSGINRAPNSPSPNRLGSLPAYRQLETKLQISIRTKVAQGLVFPNADLWVGFTQQSLWQLWSKSESAPFRATDYEPEAVYVVSVPKSMRPLPFGWQFRMLQAGLAHQSNGQAIPLSRSWNRVYLGAGFERGDLALTVRAHKRISEDAERDDNPDLTDYRGNGDVTLAWTPGNATAALLYRTSFRNSQRGSVQFDWTYPVDSSKPKGLRWYAQVFTGYGESLLDYNYRQTSFGAGLSLFEF